MIRKYWTGERSGSSPPGAKQSSLSICRYFRPVQRQSCRLRSSSRSQNERVNDLSLFCYLLCLLVQESQTVHSQGWCPRPIPTILGQSDGSIIPKNHFQQGRCCQSPGITVRICCCLPPNRIVKGLSATPWWHPMEPLLLPFPSKQDLGWGIAQPLHPRAQLSAVCEV